MLISSRENALIKDLCALVSSKKERDEKGLFVCEGARLACDYAQSGAAVKQLFVTESASKRYQKYLSYLYEASKETYEITDNVSEKISDTKSPQGVFAVLEKRENTPDFQKDGLFVMLCELQDPGNIGTILRTCDAMGVNGVILSKCADIYSPKLLRSSMGCLSRLPVMICKDPLPLLSDLKGRDMTLYASALHHDSISLPNVKFSPKSCVLIGNEGNGLSSEIIDFCDETVFIPMRGKTESLNAASAASILIYSASEKIFGEAENNGT